MVWLSRAAPAQPLGCFTDCTTAGDGGSSQTSLHIQRWTFKILIRSHMDSLDESATRSIKPDLRYNAKSPKLVFGSADSRAQVRAEGIRPRRGAGRGEIKIEGSAAAWVQPTVQSSPVRGFLQARTLTCSNFQPSDIVETIWVSSSSWHCNTR